MIFRQKTNKKLPCITSDCVIHGSQNSVGSIIPLYILSVFNYCTPAMPEKLTCSSVRPREWLSIRFVCKKCGLAANYFMGLEPPTQKCFWASGQLVHWIVPP